jgi:hypothetical protein
MDRQGIIVNEDIRDFNLTLEQDVKVLKTVVVQSSKSDYKRDLGNFKKWFLGQTINSEKCTILNIDSVQLSYRPDSSMLKATCNVPIEIENRALGYRIFYTLQYFMVDFTRRDLVVSAISGIPRFEPLYPDREGKDFELTKERDRAYYGSLNHFMRSLWSDKLKINKFRLYNLRTVNASNSQTMESMKTRTQAWYELSVQDFRNVAPDSLLELKIVYTGAIPEYNYNPTQNRKQFPQISFFTYFRHPLVIHENGYYDDPLDFYIGGYMGWREPTIAELLPIEYQPGLTWREERKNARLAKSDSLRKITQKR